MKKIIYSVFCAWIFIVIASGCTGTANEVPAIIPAPQQIEMHSGSFTFPQELTIAVPDISVLSAVNYLNSQIPRQVKMIFFTNDTKGDIIFNVDDRPDDGSYTLLVGKKMITMTAGGVTGIINAISSLRHMLPPVTDSEAEPEGPCTIPALEINDFPRFEWRGLHLDVARHFLDKEEVMRLLDVMAFYKLNKFHWHLTDDQGWRVEIKKYPELTEKGGWREFNSQDRSCLRIAERDGNPDMLLPEKRLREENGKTLYGGYYTQDDIREVVEYAALLGIDVIPELDMPGHSQRAIDNFPYLSCFGKPDWGHTFSSPLCPGKDTTLEFCKNVYAEIFELFPYKYIHLGADEVEKDNWKKCPHCQKRIRDEKLDGEVELQAWFVREMEAFFNANGRTLLGWDEIADGTLSPTAAVMWWRNWAPKNVRKAVSQGNYVVMCPNTEFYLDYAEGKYALTNIYNFDPYRERLQMTEEQKKYVLGIQGNLWAEWIPSWERVGYQYFPRVFAVSETAWTMPENKDEEDFNRRVMKNYARLEAFGMNYRLPAIEGYYDVNAFVDSTEVSIDYPMENVTIRYTTDGTIPVVESPAFVSPMKLDETTDLSLRLFRHDGRPGDVTRYRFVKSEYTPSLDFEQAPGEGLKVKWYDYRGSDCVGIDKAPLKGEYITDGVRIPEGVRGNIGLVIDGLIDIPDDGIYTFWLNSDDGSVLMIDDELVINNDGAHSPREIIGQKALRKGFHKIHARYWDNNGGTLQMGMIDGNGEKIGLDDKGWFRH